MVRALRGLLAATLVLAATAATAEAQSTAPRFGFNAGVGLPMGDFGDAAETGFHVGFQFENPIGTTMKLRLNADLGRYAVADPLDGDWTLIGGMANLVFPLATDGGFRPYLLGGIGMYNAKADITGFGSADQTKVAFNVGAGFNFMAGSLNMFTEVKYLSIQTDEALNTLPIVIGFRF